MRKSLIIILSAFVLFATSCKKDDDQPAVTVQSLAGTYKVSKVAIKAGTSAETELTDYYLDACEKDNLYTLNTNLTYTEVDAGTSCGYGNYESEWSLTNTTTIVVDGETYTIRKFDGKNLELTQSETYNGVSGSLIIYYVKQ